MVVGAAVVVVDVVVVGAAVVVVDVVVVGATVVVVVVVGAAVVVVDVVVVVVGAAVVVVVLFVQASTNASGFWPWNCNAESVVVPAFVQYDSNSILATIQPSTKPICRSMFTVASGARIAPSVLSF